MGLVIWESVDLFYVFKTLAQLPLFMQWSYSERKLGKKALLF